MNTILNLQTIVPAISEYRQYLTASAQANAMRADLQTRVAFFRSWTEKKLREASRDDLVELMSPLWSMAMWGNKAAQVDQTINDNGLENLRNHLADLIWGSTSVAERWDRFRKNIKRIGPATMSELLAHVFPEKFLPWTRVTQTVYQALKVPNTPNAGYPIDGKTYVRLCEVAIQIGNALRSCGVEEPTVMEVNYFLWWLNENDKLLTADAAQAQPPSQTQSLPPKTAEFLHNDVRDKLADIGKWLGLQSETEVKVAQGAVVDTIWEATIGNMGRVIYVFEVQTGGSIDSLILNLMKSLNNPAVQGVVAVSDKDQLLKIELEAASLPALKGKLKYWDYTEVLKVHESLESVNSTINKLGLVPSGF